MTRRRGESWHDYIARVAGARGLEEFDKAIRDGATQSVAAETTLQDLTTEDHPDLRHIMAHVRDSYGWHGGIGDPPNDNAVLAIVRATVEYLEGDAGSTSSPSASRTATKSKRKS